MGAKFLFKTHLCHVFFVFELSAERLASKFAKSAKMTKGIFKISI
jgi:hypothetical protein